MNSFISKTVPVTVQDFYQRDTARWRVAGIGFWSAGTLLLVLFGEPLFLVNDSPAMKGVVSGEFTGDPVSQLYFSSRALAFILAGLYTLPIAIQWFSWLQLLIILVASSLIVLKVQQRALLVSWYLFLTPIVVLSALRPDYTFTALVGTVLGAAAFWISMESGNSKSSIPASASALLVILMASLWRPNAALLAMAVLLPGWLTVLSRNSRRFFNTLPVLVVLFAFLTQELFRRTQSGAWGEWVIYNRIRGELHTPRMQFAELLADQAGWSDTAIRIFRSFATVDEPTFDLGALIRLDNTLPAGMPGLDADIVGVAAAGMRLLAQTSGYLIMAFALFLGASLLVQKCCSWKQIPQALNVVYWLTLVIVLATVRLPNNLLFPLALGIGGTLGLIVTVGEDEVAARSSRKVIAGSAFVALGFAICLGTMTLGARSIPAMYMEGESLKLLQSQSIADLRNSRYCSAFVAAPTATAGLTLVDPYGQNIIYSLPYLTLGWPVNSPAWRVRADQVLAGRSVLEALRVRRDSYDEPGVCLLASRNTAEDFGSLMAETGYGLFEPVSEGRFLEPERGIHMWRFLEYQ